MRATEFEFRYRVWVIAALFMAGYWAYALDPENVVVAAVRGLGVDPTSPDFHARVRAVFALGAALAVLAALLRTWAAAFLTSEVIHDQALHAEALVADGPFRHVRNPLYLAVILLSCGFALGASRLGFAIIVAGMFVAMLRLIGREEAELARTQGAPYEVYRREVPRLWPSLRPRLPASGRRPRWGQAILGELFSWVFAAAGIVFAATGDARLFGRICGLGLITLVLFMALRKRRSV